MDLKLVRQIADFYHRDQVYRLRNWDVPYIYHLHKTWKTAVGFGEKNPRVLEACYLHDILEDTVCCEGLLLEKGVHLSTVDLVDLVTDPPGKNRKERKAKAYERMKYSLEAQALKYYDRVANVEACVENGNKGLFSMYKKEHPEFLRHIKAPNGQIFDYLNRLLALNVSEIC